MGGGNGRDSEPPEGECLATAYPAKRSPTAVFAQKTFGVFGQHDMLRAQLPESSVVKVIHVSMTDQNRIRSG